MNYEIIREARKNKGLTMKDLADKIGKFSSYIAEIESGKRYLRMSNIEKICEALDLEIIIRKKTMKTLDTYNDYEVKARLAKVCEKCVRINKTFGNNIAVTPRTLTAPLCNKNCSSPHFERQFEIVSLV